MEGDRKGADREKRREVFGGDRGCNFKKNRGEINVPV